ncbi:oligosaccharide repeat unit polymerase [Curtobacterium sp. UNCCL17]|uniref:oligosaccharide repeat unit polymerase n=1 Tax=Curtobacterium sp. UNCCL17 TaxID=1449051 RepID=UPI0009DEA17D|nr:oligosaccharide repeat unit polymerase [Curtobacterium sp. UNCCL17]
MIRPNRLFQPWILLLVPVLGSLVAWLVPGEGTYLRGFAVRSELSPVAAFVLISWYLGCVLAISFGVAVGRSWKASPVLLAIERNPKFELVFYRILTLFALLGVVGAYYLIARETSILAALQSAQANVLSEALLDGSSVGTLRYAVTVAAPVGVILALEHKASWLLAALNVIMLLLVVLLSSRLSLIMAIAVFVFLYYHRRPHGKLRLGVAGVGIVSLFLVLAVFNFTRNANYYRAFGVENPFMMNVYQILSYVGAPSQVSVGVADAIGNGRFPIDVSPVDALQSILPTFLQSTKGDKSAALDLGFYAYQVDIAPNLNANSSFADVYARWGWWGLVYTLLVLAAAAVLFQHFRQYDSVVAVMSGVVAYGFLEYWRGYLFNTGNIVFLVLIVALSAFIARILTGAPVGTGSRQRVPTLREIR